MINRLDADLVAVVGDLVDGSVRRAGRGRRAAAGPALAGTAAFFVTGNHEYYSGFEEWVEEVTGSACGCCATSGRRSRARAGLDLAGVNDVTGAASASATGPTSTAALGDRDPSRPVVLLAHQPVAGARGGPVRRRPAAVRAHPRRADGAVQPGRPAASSRWSPASGEVDGTQVYVTNGAGFWGPPVRVGAPPQVTLVELRTP